MVNEVNWESLRSLATIVSALCAILAASVSWAVWRKARSGDFSKQIAEGDALVKAHADKSYDQLRDTVETMSEHVDAVRNSVGRIEAHQASEEKHVLRPRDLGSIHEKVNRLAEDLAATRAQSAAETRMLIEQLRVIQRFMQENSQRNSR